MRVAYVNADSGVPAFGRKGCCIHVQEVIRAMLQAGADVELFTRRVDGAVPADLAAVKVHTLSPLPKNEPLTREQAAVAANAETIRLLSLGAFDMVYERYSLWSDAGMQFAQRSCVPGVLEVNAPLIDEESDYRVLANRTLAVEVARRAFSAATLIVAVSDEVAAHVRTFPEADGKVEVVPNAVNAQRFFNRPSPALPAAGGIFTIGFVGTLKPWHGLDVLAQAYRDFHGWHPTSRLLIVGDGPERTRVEEQLRGLSAVFTGSVPPDEIPALLASMDVAVAPYPKLANFYFSPLKLYEYMAAAVPVIASRIGQIEKVVAHGITGWLVEPGDAKALAQGLSILLSDPPLREHIADEARRVVLKYHTWEKAVRRIFDLAFIDLKSPHKANS